MDRLEILMNAMIFTLAIFGIGTVITICGALAEYALDKIESRVYNRHMKER